MIKVGIIGFGGIAQSAHLKPHLELEAKGITKLVSVCDVCPERFEKNVDINIGESLVSLGSDVKKYSDWRMMLEKEDIDMVDICVPTFLHEEITIGALETGHHVLCEKPMSLNYEACQKMCETAKRMGKKLMIGHSFRFDPKLSYLKKLVDDGTFGKVKSAVFKRLSPPPVWGWDNWFMDNKRSGGCILDLHIHDVDAIRYIMGEPTSASCCTQDVYSKRDIAHTRLMYDDFSILATCDWTRQGIPFEWEFSVALEKATVVGNCDGVSVYKRNEEKISAVIDNKKSHQREIEYFIDCLVRNKENIMPTPEDSALSVKLINTLIESSDKNGEFVEFVTE